MAASAGTVTLDLDANSVKLIRELQKAQKQTKRTATRMRKDMARSFKSMGRAAAGFGLALAAATKVSIDFADKIGKTAKATGLTAEKFQELGFAAKRSGVETSLFSSSMVAFVKRVGEAQAGMGPLVSGLKNLNPELLKNITNAKNQAEALEILADGVANARTATEKAAITNAAFGRSGVVMVNMLRDGSSGLQDMAKKARSLGVVMDNELVKNAELAADKIGDLQKVLQVRIASAITENAEAIITLTEALISLIGKAGDAAKAWREFAEDIAVFTTGRIAFDDFQRRAEKILDLEDQLEAARKRSINFLGRENRLWMARAKSLEEQIRLEREALTRDLQDFSPRPQGRSAPGTVDKLGPGPETLALKDSLAFINQEMQRRNALELEYATTRAQYNLDQELNELAQSFAYVDGLMEERNALESEYQGLIAATRTQEELHIAQIERVGELYNAGVITSAEEYAEIVRRIGDEYVQAHEKAQGMTSELDEFGVQAARNIQSQFADFLFDPFDDGIKGMAKGFGEAIRRMAAEAAAAAILKSLFGVQGGSGGALSGLFGGSGGGFGSFLAGIFGGGKAMGGPVAAGVPYLVGEQGPEILVPRTAGTIVPNHQMGGQVITNVYLPKETTRRTANQTANAIANNQRREVARNQ